MSPNNLPGSDSEDPRRAMSPAGSRPIKPTNGLQQTLPSNPKGRPPIRPRREDEGTDEGTDGGPSESFIRERAMSPDQGQVRAKSPSLVQIASRAVSPAQDGNGTGQQPNMATVVMGMNGLGARSESPVVDRSKPPADAFYNPAPGSIAPNGFANARPVAGSTGNMTADLIRDLKTKEAEMDALKKKDLWMKMALAQAYRSGFVYASLDSAEDEDMAMNVDWDSDDPGEQRISDMVLKFKQFKAQLHVRLVP
jgi:hypothetical protein